MNTLSFRKFTRELFPEYCTWFQDADLNSHLGPMDEDWLNCVLAEDDSDGITWAVFNGAEMVGVVETVFDREGNLPAVISGIAVKQNLRCHGIGSAILRRLFAMHVHRGVFAHQAYIHIGNLAGLRLAEKVGFLRVSSEPDEQGYLTYRQTGKK